MNQEKVDKLNLEKVSFETELSKKESEIKILKIQLEESEELKKVEMDLKKNNDDAMVKIKDFEEEVASLKEELLKNKDISQSLKSEKLKLETIIEELKQKISGLELSNTILKETGAMLDEQLEDYDKFTSAQTQKIEQLTQEK